MKLLKPQEIQDTKNREITLSILRKKELQETEKESRLALIKVEAQFKERLAQNQELWAKQEESHAQRVIQMKAEITLLEAQRINALIPAGLINETTQGRLNDAMEYVAELNQKEEDLELLKEKLESRLDEVGQLEQDTRLKEKKISLREDGAFRQAENIKLQSEQLTKALSSFAEKKQKTEDLLDKTKIALILKERTLLAKEESQKRTDKALLEKEIKLADERGILEKAWEELKNKYPPK